MGIARTQNLANVGALDDLRRFDLPAPGLRCFGAGSRSRSVRLFLAAEDSLKQALACDVKEISIS